MEDGAGALHPSVVAATDDLAVDDQHGADGDAAVGETCLGFGDGGGEELVVRHGHPAVMPPSMVSTLPVTNPEASEAK